MTMLKSYRSTYEISQFSKRIRQNLDVEAIERYGEKPAIHSFKNEADELGHINHCIELFFANYNTEPARQMLYVACTRAMHRLTLTHTGKRTSLIN